MDVASGKIPMTSQPASEQFYKAYNVSFWTMPQADAADLAEHPVRHQPQVRRIGWRPVLH